MNAVGGVVYLRGQVDRPDIITDIEARVRRIGGVEHVGNLPYTHGTPARMV